MNQNDPKGYYSILGLRHDADAAEIKSAFRRKAMEMHPDRNKSSTATSDFQFLNEAYNVLSDPNLRAEYDTIGLEKIENESIDDEQDIPEPVVCSCCGSVTAQPRYVMFYQVKSFIFLTTKSVVQGIYCSACANKKALKASLITWILGWWGLPWGIFYSIQSLFVNMMGGKRPNDINAKIAAHQAWVFAMSGKIDIAKAIAFDALGLAEKTKNKEDIFNTKAQLYKLLDIIGNDGGNLRLKNVWSNKGKAFYTQAIPLFSLFGLIAFLIFMAANENNSYTPPSSGIPYSTNYEQPNTSVVAPPEPEPEPEQPAPPVKPVYIRPATDPNGNPWPRFASYIDGFPLEKNDGLSKVTIDNSQNDSDVFLKIVTLDEKTAHPVRTVFIPAFGKFTFENLTAGNYDVRYRDLDTGALSRSESFKAEEIQMYDGTQFSNMTMTLYKVKNGNMQTYDLREDEF